MKIIGYQEIECRLFWDKVADIVSETRVQELSQSIDDIGLLHEPIVRVGGDAALQYALLTGHDRVAAHVFGDRPTVLCKLVDCTDAEAEDIQDHENIFRRHDPEKRRQEMERLLARYSAEPEPPPSPPKRGRPPTAESRARKEVAKQTGKSEEAVRGVQKRARARREPKPEGPLPDIVPPEPTPEWPAAGDLADSVIEKDAPLETLPERPEEACIDTLGIEVGDAWLKDVETIQEKVDAVARNLATAQAGLTALEKLEVDRRAVGRMRDELKVLAAAVRRSRPGALCHWCKGQPDYQEKCTACVGRGWVSEGQLDSVPMGLRETGAKAAIQVGGKLVLLSKLPKPVTQPPEEELELP